MYEYTATTSNATNKITAVATDDTAEISILNGETEVENEGTATWETGENVVTITVTDGTYPKTETKTYKVTVTKS